MTINVRQKGQRAERAFIKELQPVIDRVYVDRDNVPKLERNLMQSMKGGYDIIGLEWLALEIKHQEKLNIKEWWKQTLKQAGETRMPVLAYKQNNIKWRVVMWGTLNGGIKDKDEFSIQLPVDIPLESFLTYFEQQLRIDLASKNRK